MSLRQRDLDLIAKARAEMRPFPADAWDLILLGEAALEEHNFLAAASSFHRARHQMLMAEHPNAEIDDLLKALVKECFTSFQYEAMESLGR